MRLYIHIFHAYIIHTHTYACIYTYNTVFNSWIRCVSCISSVCCRLFKLIAEESLCNDLMLLQLSCLITLCYQNVMDAELHVKPTDQVGTELAIVCGPKSGQVRSLTTSLAATWSYPSVTFPWPSTMTDKLLCAQGQNCATSNDLSCADTKRSKRSIMVGRAGISLER